MRKHPNRSFARSLARSLAHSLTFSDSRSQNGVQLRLVTRKPDPATEEPDLACPARSVSSVDGSGSSRNQAIQHYLVRSPFGPLGPKERPFGPGIHGNTGNTGYPGSRDTGNTREYREHGNTGKSNQTGKPNRIIDFWPKVTFPCIPVYSRVFPCIPDKARRAVIGPNTALRALSIL